MTYEATVDLGPLKDMKVRFDWEAGYPADAHYRAAADDLWITEIEIRGQWIDSDRLSGMEDWIKVAEQTLLEKRIQELHEDRAEEQYDRQQEKLWGYP